MTSLRPKTILATHAVHNQPEPRTALDLWGGDVMLRDAVSREGGAAHADRIAAYAAEIGCPAALDDARDAHRYPPELRLFDAGGRRLDEVRFHPAYHAMMRRGLEAGYSSIAWTAHAGGHVAHAAMVYLASQVEPGTCCPMTMTYAAVPSLHVDPVVAGEWIPRVTAARYDPTSRPAWEKDGATIGMAMTEKQGGSDVRRNDTRAEPNGEGWRLTGHKWFCSAPMCDAFLTLAQTNEGLTCFLVPRWTPDGERNAIQIQRLKDKLGDRSNASSEIEYHGAWAQRLGEPGRGVKTIIEMVHHTRLDTSIAPAGFMRRALTEAAWWCRGRTAFQRKLIDQPLMRGVLADLTLDWVGAFVLSMRIAGAFDRSAEDPAARAFARIAVALAKYLNNKRCPGVIYEAMECLGGSGYVEESPVPMLYRQAPLNSIWEGSGNVICLDVLRTLGKVPEARDVMLAALEEARGVDRRYDGMLDGVIARLGDGVEEAGARHLVESLASLLQAASLVRAGPQPVAEGYIATRLGDRPLTFGANASRLDTDKILELL